MIITTTRMIECVSWNWYNKTEDELTNIIDAYCSQKQIADKEGKRFEVYSKWSIPVYVKAALRENEIGFVEDNPDKKDYDV